MFFKKGKLFLEFKSFDLTKFRQFLKEVNLQIVKKMKNFQKRYTLPILFILFLFFSGYLIYYQNKTEPIKSRNLINYIIANTENLEKQVDTILQENTEFKLEDLDKIQNLIQEIKNVKNNTPSVCCDTEIRIISESFENMLSDWEAYLSSNLLLEINYRYKILGLSKQIQTLLLDKHEDKISVENLRKILNLTKEIIKTREFRLKTVKEIFKQNQILVWLEEENKKIQELEKILQQQNQEFFDLKQTDTPEEKKILNLYNQKYLDSFIFKLEKSDFYTKSYQQNKEFLTNRIFQFLQKDSKDLEM